MSIVGLNFTKIVAEKKEGARGKINVSNNVTISNVEETDLALGASKQKGVKFSFKFVSKYDPDLGLIELEGNLMYIEDQKKVKNITKEWKKNKKVPQDVMTEILNAILQKSNLEALLLSREVNLPPPIPLPKVNIKDSETK